MSARRTRAADWKAVAEIDVLKSRVAEMAAAQAGRERGSAAERHEEAEAALGEAQDGWAAALAGGAFDPGLARHWFAHVGRRQAEERTAGEALADADRQLAEKRAAWHGAQARADVVGERARSATAAEARQREEIRLEAVEDRAALQRRDA